MAIAVNRGYVTSTLLRVAEATWANVSGALIISSSSQPSLDLVMLGSILGGVALVNNPSRLATSPTLLKVSIVAAGIFCALVPGFVERSSLSEREITTDQSALGQILMGFSIGIAAAEVIARIVPRAEAVFTFGAVLSGATVQVIHDAYVASLESRRTS